MKVMVLGAGGMAGHMIFEYLRETTAWSVTGTVRTSDSLRESMIVLDAADYSQLVNALTQWNPDVVVNAIGVLNHRAERNVREAIVVNAVLPHRLEELAVPFGFRLVHISTDCVFRGTRGHYMESDLKDGTSVYAKTKGMGEVTNAPHITVRTSIIGPELKEDGIGLMHWFLKQKGQVKGYRRVYWSGVTTLELAKAIVYIVTHKVSGLVHLTNGLPITKYDLLTLMKVTFERSDIAVSPSYEPVEDRTLINTREDFPYVPPSYETMLRDLALWMRERGSLYA